MTTIRLATPGDMPAIAALMEHEAETSTSTFTILPEGEAAWLQRFREQQSMYPWLVASDDGGAFLGFAKAGPFRPKDAYAYTIEVSIYLRPEARGHGLGKKLYAHLLRLVSLQGYHVAIAVVTSPNPASERLHASAGMRLCGTLSQVGFKFDRWHDTKVYEVLLNDEQHMPAMIQPVSAVAETS